MLLDQLLQIQTNLWHHLITFTTISLLLTLWSKELTRTALILIIISCYAEFLQLCFPRIFTFEWMDIGWNILGCMLGMSLAFATLAANGGRAFPKTEEPFSGNDT